MSVIDLAVIICLIKDIKFSSLRVVAHPSRAGVLDTNRLVESFLRMCRLWGCIAPLVGTMFRRWFECTLRIVVLCSDKRLHGDYRGEVFDGFVEVDGWEGVEGIDGADRAGGEAGQAEDLDHLAALVCGLDGFGGGDYVGVDCGGGRGGGGAEAAQGQQASGDGGYADGQFEGVDL